MHRILDILTLFFYILTSWRFSKKKTTEQFENNKAEWDKLTSGKNDIIHKGFIEKQYLMTNFLYGTNAKLARKLFFDGRDITAADNSCEVIAVYNAIHDLNIRSDVKDSITFPELLKEFSSHGISARGVFGTSPGALKRYFVREGYKVKTLSPLKVTERAVKKLSNDYDTFIFTTYNVRYNPARMIHTMCITYDRGKYRIHNDYAGGKTYKSLYEAVTGYKDGVGHPFYVLGIKKDR